MMGDVDTLRGVTASQCSAQHGGQDSGTRKWCRETQCVAGQIDSGRCRLRRRLVLKKWTGIHPVHRTTERS